MYNKPFNFDNFFISAVFPVSLTLMGYFLFYSISHHPKFHKKFIGNEHGSIGWIRYVLFQKSLGFIFMGILPGCMCMIFRPEIISAMGISVHAVFDHWLWFVFGIVIAFLLSHRAALEPDTQARYPEMKIHDWTPIRFAMNSLGWIIYLTAYEFLFRGILLFGCYMILGRWPAIMINVIIYAGAHIAKGWRETVVSVGFGVALCIATLNTGTVLLPLIVHLVMAINTEYLCIRFRKDMNFSRAPGV